MTYATLEKKLATMPEEYFEDESNFHDYIQQLASSRKKNAESRRIPGALKGQLWMANDFDEPIEDFKEYM